MKVRKEQIINIFILVYVVLIMTSSNTGLLATKLIRLLLPFLIILFLIYRRYIKKDSFSFAIWGLLFLGYCLIRAPYATDTNYAYNYIASTFYVFIINACIYAYLTTSPHQIYPLIKSLIWGSVIANIYAFTRYGIMVFILYRGAEGIGNANIYGAHSAIGLVLSFFIIKTDRELSQKGRYLYSFLMVLLGIFTILSGSRKVYIYIAVPFVMYYILKNNNPIKALRNVVAILLCIFVLIQIMMKVPFLYDNIGSKVELMISGLMGGESDASTSTRMALINYGLEMFRQNPIFGHGLGNYVVLLHIINPNFASFYAHNNYIELLVDCGIVGTLIYYSIYIKALAYGIKKILRIRSTENLIILGLLISMMICEYGQVSYYSAYLQLVLMMTYFLLRNNEV